MRYPAKPEGEIEYARRLVAAAERANKNLDKVKAAVEVFYGLSCSVKLFENIRQAQITVMSPKGHHLLTVNLKWTEDGRLQSPSRMADELATAIQKVWEQPPQEQ
jgi:hypothetical protein